MTRTPAEKLPIPVEHVTAWQLDIGDEEQRIVMKPPQAPEELGFGCVDWYLYSQNKPARNESQSA